MQRANWYATATLRFRRNALGSHVTLSSAFGSVSETYRWTTCCHRGRVSRQLPRHYKPGTSLKYANIQFSLSGRPFRFLGYPSLARMRRNVYDHGEIKSTAKILPLIRMWSLLLSVAVASFILDPLQLPLKPARYRCCSLNDGTQD